jgi:Tol biopolymer transport system component
MTTERHLERDLPEVLGDLAMGPYPDYIDDVLATTAHRRQRPAWTFPERWLPMDLAAKALPGAARLPWRIVAVLALLLVLVAAMLAFYVGSQRRLPAPFGPAANGSIVFTARGDIYAVDPRTGTTTAIVASPATEIGPVYSLDGARVAFERKVEADTGPGLLFVVGDDGRRLVQVTPDPLMGLAGWSFSPDGRSIVALAKGDTGPAIMVAATDGIVPPKFFDVGATLDDGAPQYRPDGLEIMFIGKETGAANRGVYALDPSTGDVRTIIDGKVSGDVHLAAWSPDGTRIAYGAYDSAVAGGPSRTHVVSVDGTGDVAVDTHPERWQDAGGAWSNDGTRLIINRFYQTDAGEIVRSAIVPIDRSSVGVEIECPPSATADNCTADWAWSPDDSVIVGGLGVDTVPMILVDPLTGRIRPAPWTGDGPPVWQRLAP